MNDSGEQQIVPGISISVSGQATVDPTLADVLYFLHQLDRVAGAAHFEVPIEEGMTLIEKIRARLPGYAVPRYVQEVPGESSKRILA